MRFINKNLIKILICLLIVINIFIVINIGTQKYDDITNARATNVSIANVLDSEDIVDEFDMLDRKDATDIEAEDRKDVIDIEVEDKKDDVINEATVWGTQSIVETLNKLNIENVEKNINAQNTMKSFDNINNLENIDSDNENNMVEDKEMYNSMIKKYVGNSKKGSDVKQMIEDVISQNSQYVNESGKFISIHVGTIAGYDSSTLESVTKAANVYENDSSENTQDTIDAARDEYRVLKQKISAGKNYTVTESEKDGIIYAVTVTEYGK